MCSSLYQRLNSASCSASTSVHSIKSPVPRVLAMRVSGRRATRAQARADGARGRRRRDRGPGEGAVDPAAGRTGDARARAPPPRPRRRRRRARRRRRGVGALRALAVRLGPDASPRAGSSLLGLRRRVPPRLAAGRQLARRRHRAGPVPARRVRRLAMVALALVRDGGGAPTRAAGAVPQPTGRRPHAQQRAHRRPDGHAPGDRPVRGSLPIQAHAASTCSRRRSRDPLLTITKSALSSRS